MTIPSNSEKVFFPQLNILRFVSAFGIFIMHMTLAWTHYKTNTKGGRGAEHVAGYAGQFVGNMVIGVDVFFIISGFLITYLLLKEKESSGSINLKKFYIRRILRIWPLYFFLIALSPLVIWWTGIPNSECLSSILFVENFQIIKEGMYHAPFGHLWSICVEEHFYLVWPLIIVFIPEKWFPVVLGLILIMSAGFIVYVMSANYERPLFTIYYHTLSRIDALVIGAFIAYYYQTKPFRVNMPFYISGIVYMVLIIALCITSAAFYNSPLQAILKRYFFMALLAFVVISYNFNNNALQRITNNRLLQYLGKISYGIYMYTTFIIIILMVKIVPLFHITNVYVFTLMAILPGLLIPMLSYELLEKPFLKLKNRFEIVKTAD
jgi:peptidoglycan/LPS O-acetylase OafA/YrhL